MKRRTFAILFFIKRTRLLKTGESTIIVRITVNGIRDEFLLKRAVKPENWDSKKERILGNDDLSIELNRYLDSVRVSIYSIHRELEQNNKEITARIIKQRFLGQNQSSKTILELFADHNKKMNALVGKEFSQKTADRYNVTIKHLKEFIQRQYRCSDLCISEITYQFISDFDIFLKTDKKCIHNSAVKHLKALKKIIRIALINEWIKRNPFENYKLKEYPVEKDFLTQEELNRIITKEIHIERLKLVRDIFVFCCYTGLSYIDVKCLTPEHLATDNQNNVWIYKTRQKTKNMCRIPLLEPARRIIEKYKEHPVCISENVLLPVSSNQKLNSYLLEIADICDIHKTITMNIARHTFATTVTLSNGVSLESVSRMLGHDNIRSTQIYAKITDTKIGREMQTLANKLREPL